MYSCSKRSEFMIFGIHPRLAEGRDCNITMLINDHAVFGLFEREDVLHSSSFLFCLMLFANFSANSTKRNTCKFAWERQASSVNIARQLLIGFELEVHNFPVSRSLNWKYFNLRCFSVIQLKVPTFPRNLWAASLIVCAILLLWVAFAAAKTTTPNHNA